MSQTNQLLNQPLATANASPVVDETCLQEEVNAIKARYTATPEIYREVCILLFFKYGTIPTANKLYQLVKKGSMSAPVDAASTFWETLRTKCKSKIERADIPEDLQLLAGEMVAQLWGKANDAALTSTAVFREEAQEQVLAAQDALAAGQAEQESTIQSLADLRDLHADSLENAAMLQRQLEQAGQNIAELGRQLEMARQDAKQAHAANTTLEKEHRDNLQYLREEAKKDSDRVQEAERRALLEIDRERTAAAKLVKDLEAARVQAAKDAEKHRLELSAVQTSLGDTRQQMGKLEATLQIATVEAAKVSRERDGLLADVTSLGKSIAAMEARLEMGDLAATELKTVNTELTRKVVELEQLCTQQQDTTESKQHSK